MQGSLETDFKNNTDFAKKAEGNLSLEEKIKKEKQKLESDL